METTRQLIYVLCQYGLPVPARSGASYIHLLQTAVSGLDRMWCFDVEQQDGGAHLLHDYGEGGNGDLPFGCPPPIVVLTCHG